MMRPFCWLLQLLNFNLLLVARHWRMCKSIWLPITGGRSWYSCTGYAREFALAGFSFHCQMYGGRIPKENAKKQTMSLVQCLKVNTTNLVCAPMLSRHTQRTFCIYICCRNRKLFVSVSDARLALITCTYWWIGEHSGIHALLFMLLIQSHSYFLYTVCISSFVSRAKRGSAKHCVMDSPA